MNSARKQLKKRKRSSQATPIISRIAQRLERFRSARRRDLWADDDDDDEDSNDRIYKHTKTTNRDRVYIVLSDSDEEPPVKNSKAGRKRTRNHNAKAMCLICSIMSRLSAQNCCSEHLSILKNNVDHQHTTNRSQWLPDKVMILPLTDEIVQRYIEPQQISHSRTQTPVTNRNMVERNKSATKKSVHKATATVNISETEPIIKLNQMDTEPTASSIVIEPASISVPNETETRPITNDDTIANNQAEESTIAKPMNPWSPLREDVDATLEHVLVQLDSAEESPLEFTPTTARRTDTEVMAALLPKIPLKKGRFRPGRSTLNRTPSNAANQYRPTAPTTKTPSEIDNIPITTTLVVDNPPTTSPNDNTIDRQESGIEQNVTSSTTTPSRLSYRLNPDGTRVSISRPVLATNRRSPLLSSLRRLSTDVTPVRSNTKQV